MPALKAGKALWVDDSDGGSSPESFVVQTPEADENEEMGDGMEYESEEEEAMPKTTTRNAPLKQLL